MISLKERKRERSHNFIFPFHFCFLLWTYSSVYWSHKIGIKILFMCGFGECCYSKWDFLICWYQQYNPINPPIIITMTIKNGIFQSPPIPSNKQNKNTWWKTKEMMKEKKRRGVRVYMCYIDIIWDGLREWEIWYQMLIKLLSENNPMNLRWRRRW